MIAMFTTTTFGCLFTGIVLLVLFKFVSGAFPFMMLSALFFWLLEFGFFFYDEWRRLVFVFGFSSRVVCE